MLISIIIPARNEQDRLARTLENYSKAALASFGDNFEIIVVANGYSDDTVRIAEEMALKLPQLSVIDILQPIGKGGAILEGFRKARGLSVFFVDADGATPPAALFNLLKHRDSYDIIIGSRRLPDSVITRSQPLSRRFFGNCFAATVRLMFGLPYRDTQCGAKLFSNEAARRLAEVVNEKRWAFDVDLLLWSKRLGLKVAERAVVWEHQTGSQLRIGATISEVLQALWRMKCRHRQNLAPILTGYVQEANS